MIDRRPVPIAHCTDVADVIAIIDHARESGTTLAVRGGGHHAGGLSVWDDAIVCDPAAIRGVRVDAAITAHVEHGARLPSTHSTMHLCPIDRAPAGTLGARLPRRAAPALRGRRLREQG